MMGAGIAYVCAQAGLDVVLKDVSHRGREKGKALLRQAPGQGRLARPRTAEKRDDLPARITPTAVPADLAGLRPRHRGGLREPP